ncbi:family 2 encapsulin nanocompartment cargo protein polyprenyl transferase [Thermomonospora cellulosilytica]|uniref:Geranylgeranyl diphosphate synthase type I n=1 Tax=Thermomonospora cellulosilytica TaxID=1411118 RepID=A0A7W3N028_9ACTN|nr:family 2 encapsulin nanocompartment cargo protein polyprenyl transferase [Thermomonospora cellulosilytica]MBA9005045.1 geranylgeranyl diphosphate synthase type I [Thermomonospora cellulosilytica]
MAMTQGADGRSAEELLSWARELVDPGLRAAVDTLPAPVRRIAGWHFGWWDEHGRPAGADPGKALRPALALLSAQAAGGAAEAALPAAVAVELVHNFSLLHDDVMDGDDTRRHRPTAWRVFGVSPAILAGDALLALAGDVLAVPGNPDLTGTQRMLAGTVQQLVAGQLADLVMEERHDVTVRECLGMAEGKTAALLACSCALGAAFAGADRDRAEALRGFGARLGLAFQIADDLLGIWGDPAVTGKPVHADLRNRKKSLPVVVALRSETTAGRELVDLYRRPAPLTEPEVRHAVELLERSGAPAWCTDHAETLLADGLRLLGSAGLHDPAAGELAALARLAARRDR